MRCHQRLSLIKPQASTLNHGLAVSAHKTRASPDIHTVIDGWFSPAWWIKPPCQFYQLLLQVPNSACRIPRSRKGGLLGGLARIVRFVDAAWTTWKAWKMGCRRWKKFTKRVLTAPVASRCVGLPLIFNRGWFVSMLWIARKSTFVDRMTVAWGQLKE